jgi:NADH-quinone oxidoreductase subunit N
MSVSFSQLLWLVTPETVVVITALAVLGADLFTMREMSTRLRFATGGLMAVAGCAIAAGLMLIFPAQANLMQGMLVVDSLTQTVKLGILALTIFTVLLSLESNFTNHVGEFLALVLFAGVGMMFLVSSEDILMIFVSLELTSLSLYILAAFNKRNIKSAEAALKYFFFGGMSAAITLFGLSLLYGLSGATNLGQIAAAIKGPVPDPMLIVAIVMTVIGFGFKVAAVPFHLWAPDAYEGAPIPSAAFIASGSKVASFFVFAKVAMIGFKGAEGSGALTERLIGWVPALALTAAASIILGNLTAIVQTSVRRLLAYSAIAHGGYMLLGVMAHGRMGVASLMYYAVTYGLTTVGAFGVVAVVQEKTGGDTLADFAGLSRRAPLVSFCMMIFMLSLAGIPPLAGFFGKFYVFSAAIGAGPGNLALLWLVILAIAMSAVSLYYYLQVLKRIYVSDLPAQAAPLDVSPLSQLVLALLAVAVLVLGCAPNLLVARLAQAVQGL